MYIYIYIYIHIYIYIYGANAGGLHARGAVDRHLERFACPHLECFGFQL